MLRGPGELVTSTWRRPSEREDSPPTARAPGRRRRAAARCESSPRPSSTARRPLEQLEEVAHLRHAATLQRRNGASLHSSAVAEETTDVAALFARLKEEVRAAGPRAADVTPAQVRLSVRDQAERLWPVSAERPIVGKGGPVKKVIGRLMRWYVEPAWADQRAFNDAVLKLIDDLDERIARLEQQQRP